MTTPSGSAQPAGTPVPPAPGTVPPQQPWGHVPTAQWQGWTPPPPPPQWQTVIAPNGLPLADFGQRLLAYVIDWLLFMALSLVYTVPLMIWYLRALFEQMEIFAEFSPDAPPPMLDFGAIMVPALVLVAANVILGGGLTYLYYVEYQLRNGGQTLGKRAMKLRVVPVDPAQQLTRRNLAMRWLIGYLGPMFVPLLNYLDGLWQLWDQPLRQCLHDKAATTVVVKQG